MSRNTTVALDDLEWVQLYLFFMLLAVISFIVSVIYSARLSNAFRAHGEYANRVSSGLLARTNDLTVTTWALMSVPVVNVVVAGAFASDVTSIERTLHDAHREMTI